MVANAGIAPAVALHATDPVRRAGLARHRPWRMGWATATANLGGLWVLVKPGALRAGPDALNISAAGRRSGHPLPDPGADRPADGAFGLTQIAWFVWLGLVLLRSGHCSAAACCNGAMKASRRK